MENFQCHSCNYSSYDKSNYKRHLKSQLHILKSMSSSKLQVTSSQNKSNYKMIIKSDHFECNFCGQQFTRNSTLTKHKRICVEAKLQEKDKDLKTKELETNKQHEIELLKQKVEYLEKNNQELKAFIKSGKFGPTYNISIKKYIQQNYSDAPPLERLETTEYAKLTYEPDINNNTIQKIQIQDNVSNNSNNFNDNDSDDEDKNDNLMLILIYNYNNNTLHKFLGDFIVKNYKKEDPAQQSIWNSDVSRLTYIIKELLSNNIESRWSADYKGTKTKNYIITPLLKYIRRCIDEFWIKSVNMFKELDIRSLENLQKNLVTLQKIKKDIDDNILTNNIVKLIAPEFYMNKEDNDKIIECFMNEDIEI